MAAAVSTTEVPPVPGADGNSSESKPTKDERDAEAAEVVRQIREAAGLSKEDPKNSAWLRMEKTDRKKGVKVPMGACCISVHILPIAQAELMPVGTGRAEPNNSPFLPPPTGRLKFGWNPISVLAQLLGPTLCFRLACICCIAVIILSVIFLQPLWNILIALAFQASS
ncbi:unnamed protein product [Discosporangium mesarthrocarpum]